MDQLNNLYPTMQIGSDGFQWWIGQIESKKADDKKGSGRYKVRIVGLHPQSCDAVSSENLPWAVTMMPVTNPHVAGGHASVSDQLEPGVWVMGFFLDTMKQQPVIMGSIGRTAISSEEPLADDPTPGESGCKSFTTFLSPNVSAADQDPEATEVAQTVQTSGHVATGEDLKDSEGRNIGTVTTALVKAKNAKSSATNPGGKNFCVEKADKCGKENDLGNSLKRIISEMLYEVQRNDGKLGTYLVGELSGELYDIVGIGREYVDKAIRLTRKFVAKVKGFVLDKIKAGIKDLTDILLGVNPEGNSLSSVTKFFNDILKNLGCSIEDLGDRLAAFLQDLLFGYLFQAYKAAACLVDSLVEGILNKITSLLEEILEAVLGPLNDILGAIASAINIVGDTINYVLDLLGISCSGPGKKCSKTTVICTDCQTEKQDDGDFLDNLLNDLDDLFPVTGEDWSQYVCEDAQSGTTIASTNVTFVGGVQNPETVPIIEYNIDNVNVTEGQDAVFTVTRTGYLDVASSVQFITKDGTATGGSDYEQKDGPLGFAVGDTEKTITIKTFLDDDDNEPNEDFFVSLSPVTPDTVTSIATNNVGKCVINKSPLNGGLPGEGIDDDGLPIKNPTFITSTQNPNTVNTNTDTTPSDPPNTIPDEDKPESKLQKFSVTADKNVVKEGDFITYTITTQNVPDNLIFNYKLFGNGITPSDIVSKSLSGQFTIVNSIAQVIVGIAPDGLDETSETLIFSIPGTGAQTSVLIAVDGIGTDESSVIEALDSSTNLTSDASPAPKTPTFGEIITDPGGGIVEIQIDDPGTEYDEPPVIIITGEGNGAAALPLLDDNGFLTEIRVTNPGRGYKLNKPEVAQKECIIDAFTLLNVGRNYKTPPTVYVNGDSTIAESVINERGQVISVRIKNRELTFDRYPEILILGGGGYGAKAIPAFSCLDPVARVAVGSAKVGTGSYVDCP